MFKPGQLWERLTRVTAQALQSGALQPIPTELELVEERGARFLVRRLSQLKRKKDAREEPTRTAVETGEEPNPFLPYEETMFVAGIGDRHVGLLNSG